MLVPCRALAGGSTMRGRAPSCRLCKTRGLRAESPGSAAAAFWSSFREAALRCQVLLLHERLKRHGAAALTAASQWRVAKYQVHEPDSALGGTRKSAEQRRVGRDCHSTLTPVSLGQVCFHCLFPFKCINIPPLALYEYNPL